MRDLDPDADRPTDPPYTPPKVTPIDDGASVARRIAVSLGNPYASVPDCAYREPLVVRSVGKTTVAYVADPDLLEEMLVKRWRDFPKSQIDHRVFGPSLGRGLLTAEGEDWKWKRRLAAPTFSPAALKAMTPA
ncbi:MAG: cytochrome P450, partial [Pseudomonadota bacterium]